MRRVKRLALVLLVVVGCLASGPGRAWACTCALPGPPAEELAKSTAVFAGKVIGLRMPIGVFARSTDPVRVTFQVHAVWKGPAQDTLVVTTARDGASCGYPFSRGSEYLVYARGTESSLETSICSRTRLLSAAGEDLIALGEGTAPSAAHPVRSTSGRVLERVAILAGGLGIQVAIVAFVIVLAARVKNRAVKAAVWAVVLYLLFGLVYGVVGLYCYNVRNWELYGGLSVPPLYFPVGIFGDLLLWPVDVWANLINGFGVFGNCGVLSVLWRRSRELQLLVVAFL